MGQRGLWLPWRRERAATRPAEAPPVEPAGPNGRPGDELNARREEIARMEERALREAESLATRQGDLDRRMQALDDRERNLEKEVEELKRSKRVQRREL